MNRTRSWSRSERASNSGSRVSGGAACDRLRALWDEIAPESNPLHRCALAHSMADVCDDPEEELLWDQRALQAASSITDDQVQQTGRFNKPVWASRSEASTRRCT